MMKRSKVVSRSSDLQRERSPLRKMHSSRKRSLHHSPEPGSRHRQSSIQRSSSLTKKHRTTSGAKHMLPPVQSSSPSTRRLPHKKPYELVKKRSSIHPRIGHELSSRDLSVRSVTPTLLNKYQNSRGRREPEPDFGSPPKKKMSRNSDRYASDHGLSPHIPVSRPVRRRSSSSPRGDPVNRQGLMSPGPSDFALSHSTERPSRTHFHSQGHDRDGYLHSPIEKRRDQSELYMNEKRYGPTLDQRFSSGLDREIEPGIHYSRSDLEKITVDIRPAIRKSSPTVRRIVNADEVKLVRRRGEGKKPIFDREEIKQAPRDMREDAHFEHKNISSLVTSNIGQYGMTRRELENYEITRRKFDTFHGPPSSGEIRTLNDRWQKPDSKKVEPSYFDRDERTTPSYKLRRSASYSDDDRPTIPRPYDKDYRGEKFRPEGDTYHRDPYPDTHRPLPSTPVDSRHSLSLRRKEEASDSRGRMLKDDEPRTQWHSVPKSTVYNNSASKIRGKRSLSRGSKAISPRRDYEPESRGNPRGGKLPSYAQRPDGFKYPSWSDKPDGPSRTPNYFEPDSRYPSEVNHFRSPGRPMSGRIFRSPYRGRLRGGMRGRGMFRGSSGGSRGLGYGGRDMKH